jgi:hypothetical protein
MFRRLPLFLNGRPRSSIGTKSLKLGGAALKDGGPLRSILSFVDAERPTLEIAAVQQLDGLLGGLVVLELDECEPTRSSGLAIRGHFRVHDLACGAERFNELLARDIEAQVPHEHLVRNGRISSLRSHRRPLPHRSGRRARPGARRPGARGTVAE